MSSNGSVISVYCEMTKSCGGITGGWMRVVELNMTNTTTQCPDCGIVGFFIEIGADSMAR